MASTPTSSSFVTHRKWLNSTVLGAGLTSALGDLSYETSNAIFPSFLAVIGIPAAALGSIEGVADAISSFTKLGAGYVADRVGHRKTLVVGGYACTAVMQIFLALAVGWPMVLMGRVVGWFGRGVRGPLRDAILAEAVTPETRGRAFGFHRAADTLGAVIGPLLGVALLAWMQDMPHVHTEQDPSHPFRWIFWLAFIPGVLSALSFALLVRDDRSVPNSALRFWATLRSFPATFRHYVSAVGLFGAGDFAHTLLILAATQLLTPRFGVLKAAQVAGLLYVWRNLVQSLSAFPVGALADRFGHRRILTFGYALGALTAALIAVTFARHLASLTVLATIFALAGLYTAIEDALEASLTAEYVSAEVRGIGYGVLGSVNGVGDLVSSTVVGTLWTLVSPVAGFTTAAILMALGTAALGWGRLYFGASAR